ncbi:hypothetical protein A3742_24720 [Oleiphilus sp. HI0071]|uniref:LPS export ABC transporter periplasmic protein LptC n=1 Tax=unclassified Oleiphilus TaxID=2631174 RepID=UPI0007C3383A|nr:MULTISPECIES: LPS export ABC transporter periplasmic protein LptC [unclassified Oleiphilus]KZY59171.1 hypothetical protein A3737_07770 [Oleiphilus sp. HI0065]KZY80095.1 hypothetical protein A3742_13545 [Oleiphilus sp. HI0071]KZY96641.1 hypothetical protein A3744_13555 [Oleiphilus sp. HI0073]KZZ50849.1 hypothetical protein A3760_13465 [Oleiphilus sp. HI0122]KZZ74166.1 hypothetical protein A3767_03930 [Oleiphilus sp. HI0133]
MARLKPRSRFVIPLIVAVFGVSIYYANQLEQKTSLIQEDTTRKPSAFAEGTELKEFNEEGELQLLIKTQRSYYYESENLIETERPLIDYVNETGEQFRLDAKDGQYRTDTGMLTLQNEVLMSRVGETNDLITFETEDLRIDTVNDFISTPGKVKITQNHNTLTSSGLKASLNDRKIELPQRVRGTYNAQK